MNASALRVLEATAIHAMQKTVELVVERAKERVVTAAELKRRVEAVEKDVADLKGGGRVEPVSTSNRAASGCRGKAA